MMNILRLLFLAGAIQGIITFLALFSFGKTHKKANYLLSFAVLALTINMFIDYLFHGSEPWTYPRHANFHAILGFTYGPLIYLYIRHLTGYKIAGRNTVIMYFMPFAFSFLFIIVCSSSYFNSMLYRYFFVVEIASLLHVLVFIILSIGYLFKHKRAIENSYSNLEKVSLQWFRLIIYSLTFIVVTAIVLYFWRSYFDIIWLMVALLIYSMSYMTLRKPEILTGMIDIGGGAKYQKSSLNAETLQKHKAKIDRSMVEDKAFLDGDLTLPSLAEKISIPVHHLSQIINQVYNKNFFEFINYYRIKAAKEMMRSQEFDEIKIIDICYRVGFNTISAFNKSFKKSTGLTPTQFRDKYRLEETG